MGTPFLIILLTVALLAIRVGWIVTDPHPKTLLRDPKQWINFSIDIIITALQIISSLYFPWPTTRFDPLIVTIGILMFIAGFIIAIWGRITMNNTWGHPGQLDTKEQKKLVTTGPFAFSRNPIYLGFILIYLGYPIALRSYFIILRIPILLYFWKSAKKEEKLLEKEYGTEYARYQKKTPLFLLI